MVAPGQRSGVDAGHADRLPGASTIGSGASGLGQFAPIWLAMVAAGAVVGAVHGRALVRLVRGDAALRRF